MSCDSTNPRVSLYAYFGTDASACSFTRDITWGDGKESVVFVQGGPIGPKYVTSHTYSVPGSHVRAESVNRFAVEIDRVRGPALKSPGGLCLRFYQAP